MTNNPRIRAIVGRFSFNFSRHALENALKEHPFEFCAHISGGERTDPFSSIPASSQEWFASSETRNAYYKGIDWNDISPLDEELIVQMHDCESEFMSLIYRLERKQSILYLKRKLWYLRHLQFWNDYIIRHRINLFLSAWVPHEIPDIVIYYLCKHRGIPILYFNTTEIPDVSFAEHDIRKSATQILPRYQELLEEYAGKNSDAIQLGEPFLSYKKGLISEKGQPPAIESFPLLTYWDHLQKLFRKRPLTFLKNAFAYLAPTGWKRAYWAILRWQLVKKTDDFYRKNTVEPDLKRPFVYFPLHYQPEATTHPMGGIFADLILAARILNDSLPENMLIYIKEHPYRSNWLNRSIEYYKEFLELDKVRLIPTTINTFDLRENCQAVATVTGSAGFEALFREKAVFLFGSRYYQSAKGIFPIRSKRDCEKAVKSIFEQGEKPTLLSSHLFMKAMEETCIPGVLDPWSLQITHKSENEHSQIMGKAIVKEIEKLKEEIQAVRYPDNI
ncbi:MAG: hypothetical protein K9M03_00195 [Kiritimatiellales bacterium]|nr:hypothetical protein [Kiritimatiellales bacterium]